MAVASGHMNSSGVLLEVGSVLPVLHSGEMQSAPGAVPASPAASGNSGLSLYSSPLRCTFKLFCEFSLEKDGVYLAGLGASLSVISLFLYPCPAHRYFFKKTLILTEKRVTETIRLDSVLIHAVWFSGLDTG